MNKITIIGIVLITAGTILTYFAHNIKNKFDDKHLQQGINDKAFQIDENSESISGKGTIIKPPEVQADEPNIQGLKRLTNEQVEAQVNKLDAPSSEPLADKQIETNAQAILKPNFSDIITRARRFYHEGKYVDAYNIVYDLRQKHPDFGLIYFILGMIEMHNEYYDKGEELLNQAVQIGLPDKDMAWAFHNLGTSSLRKNDFEQARDFLEKAVGLNPDMEESRKALKSLNNHMQKNNNDVKDSNGPVESEKVDRNPFSLPKGVHSGFTGFEKGEVAKGVIGIFRSGKNVRAVINGKWTAEGDQIGDEKVLEIRRDAVVMTGKEGGKRELFLPWTETGLKIIKKVKPKTKEEKQKK